MMNTVDFSERSASASSTSRRDLFEMPDIPLEIQRSRLMRRGGFDIFSGVADEFMRKSLLFEAIGQGTLVESKITDPDKEEIRGGVPRRRFSSCSGGDFQKRFYHADWMLEFLRELTTPGLVPTGENGTYSFYWRSGDFLDIHRDIVTCDVAVITCLKNQNPGCRDGGKLCLYPERIQDPLSSIRMSPAKGAIKVALEEGQTLVMYGGIVPHALLPVNTEQVRIVSVLCYRAC